MEREGTADTLLKPSTEKLHAVFAGTENGGLDFSKPPLGETKKLPFLVKQYSFSRNKVVEYPMKLDSHHFKFAQIPARTSVPP